MAKRTITRSSSRAKVNVEIDDDVKISKRNINKTKKQLKNTSKKAWSFGVLFLIIGILAGAGVWFGISRNDTFELIGASELTFTLAEEDRYIDEGVKIISFNKDVSNTVEIETDLKIDEQGRYYAEEVGTYYIKYTSTDFKYGKLFKIEKVRLITFVEESEGGIYD